MRSWLTVSFASSLALVSVGCIEFESDPIQAPDRPSFDLPDGGKSSQSEDGGAVVDDGVSAVVRNSLPKDFPPGFLEGGKLGEACDEDADCRTGLVCEDDECAFEGNADVGDYCLASAECDDGQCVSNVCVPAGEGDKGSSCQSSAECAAGLRCGVVGFGAQCVEDGTKDLNELCDSSNECLSGLTCFALRAGTPTKCTPIPNAPAAAPALWEGVDCDEPSEERVRAYFEIPGAEDAQEGDYFRLPWPNDALTNSSGGIDVSDFPTPGVNPIVGVDPIAPYVEAVDGMQGWGINPTAIFRFSGRIDFGSFDENGAIHWIDITDPDNPVQAPINYRTTSARSNYVCHNVFSVRRSNGFPMEPGHTYAVWLGTAGRSESGLTIDRAENFEAMLGDSAPGDSVLADAHEKYAPFRAYLSAQDIDPDEVLVATVITVGPVRNLMQELAESVRETPVPAFADWTRCGDGDSPCPQAEGGRACETNDAFDEYHALVDLPIFQEGEPPYMESGGKIQTGEPQRSEPVCVSLTVPKGATMPDDGWPLVVYGHGTGGSFRSGARQIAEEYAAVATPDGMLNFAVLGYDEVQHGTRRGDSEESPDNLFFNFLNPDAAQGNPLQGAADVISLARFAAALDLSAGDTGGDAVKVDPERIVYFGHSQGSMHGSLALPYADEYKAAVLSGNGASLMHALLSKTEPVNIKQVVPLVVNDGVELNLVEKTLTGELPGGAHHPVLSLVQRYIDPADPLAFAEQVGRNPVEGFLPKHVFQTFGVGDSFSPPTTMHIYARAADFSVVEAHSSAEPPFDLGTESMEFPLTASFGFMDLEYTGAVRQYGPPEGRDGHFVVFDVPTATSDAARFLGMAAEGLTPQVGE